MAMLPPDPIYVLKGEQGAVNTLSAHVTPYSEHLYVGTQDGRIHIWDLQINREVKKLVASKDGCLNVVVYKENQLLVQEKSGLIRLWNLENWEIVQEFVVKYCGFCKFVVYNDIIVVPSSNVTVKLLSISDGREIGKFKSEEKLGEVMCIKITTISNNDYVLAGYESGDVKLWKMNDFSLVSGYKYDEECVMAIDFDSEDMKGICGGPTNKIHVFTLNKDSEFSLKKEILVTNAGVGCIVIRADKKLVVIGGWDGKIRLLSWKNLITLAVLDSHSASIHDVMFYKCNNKFILAAGSKDCKVSLWDLYNK